MEDFYALTDCGLTERCDYADHADALAMEAYEAERVADGEYEPNYDWED